MIGILKKIPYPRTLAAAAAVFVAYLLLGFLLAPYLIERAIPGYAADKLQRKASVGGVRVNPLLFKLEVRDFALAERDGAPIAAFRRLLVDFEASSLARRAWTFSEIALEGLDLRADVAPDGRFNLAALLDSFPKEERRPGEKAPRLLLQRVALTAGTIAFSDRSGRTPASAQITPVNLELHDLSTLPDHRGAYTVSARLMDGGVFTWRGEASLDPLSSQGEIGVKGARPLSAWRFLRDELNLAEPRGEFDFGARYRFAYADGAMQATLDDIRLAIRGLALAVSGAKEPLLELASIAVAGGRFDLATRELRVASVEARDGRIAAEVDARGMIDWQKLVKAGPGDKAREPGAGPARKPWRMKVESVRTAGLGLRYIDRSRAKPLQFAAQELAAGLAATLETRPGGVQLLLEGIALNLARPALGEPGAKAAHAAFDAVAVEGGNLDLEQHRLGVARVAIKGGLVQVGRDKSGPAGILSLVGGANAGLLRREVAGALKEAKAEGRPWAFAVDTVEIDGTRIALSDQSYGAPIAYDANILRARLGGYRSNGRQPVKAEVSVRFAQGGSLAAGGVFLASGDAFKGRVKLDRINLKPLHPAIASRARAVLASGELSGEITADYRARKGRHELRASGPVSIDNLLLNEAEGGERLLAWKKLSTTGFSLTLAPDELKVAEARVVELGAKVVVFRDRSVNLVKVVVPESAQAGEGAASGPPPPTTALADTDPLFPVSIERVTVEKGAVNFSDLSLVLPFSANVHELQGVVQGIGNDRASRASVRLEGRVDEYGLARAEGSLRPFRPKSFLDLSVTFRNVEMPPLSPYTVTFAGRRIASGRLALDLRYKIDNSVLAGDNRVVLEKFTLGERVEAPGALSLPLDLAVALLTDSSGRIDLTVPVHGNVDDPQFSYGHVIWQAIVNVLTRIVTAPFRALASLFGGGEGENLESIAFDPGRAALLPPEREKLKRVAEGLGKRPQIRLVAEGQHGAADRAALRQRDVELAVAARLGRAPAAGRATEPVSVMDARTQRALEAIFVERNSGQALSQLVTEVGKSRGRDVQRVNAALALVGRASADREFYETLLKRLNDTAPVADEALAQLAGARARAVTDHLSGVLAVPAERAEARTAATPGEAQVKLAFDVARSASQ